MGTGMRKSVNSSLWMLSAIALALLLILLVFVQGAKAAQAEDEPEFEGQVVGGAAVPNEKYPFMAALLDTRYGNNAYQQQFCGGTLIDRDSVLTAAHCVSGASARPLRVAVGRTVLKSSQGQVRRVSKIFVHPRYNDRRTTRDAAVLKLARPVNVVEPIKPASASQDFLEKRGTNATVAGWGNTRAQPIFGFSGVNYPNRMRETRVPLRPDSYAGPVYGGEFVPPLMVAAGKTGKDTCQGDSGGPMFKKTSGGYRQIGITSFGYGCAAPGYPGVYAEVNNYSIRKFISSAASR